MHTRPRITAALAAIVLAGTATAQTFSLAPAPKAGGEAFSAAPAAPTDTGVSSGGDAWFVLAPPAQKLVFSFLPPARELFVDLAGNVALFPALFPGTVHFHELGTVPGFFAGRFQGVFTAWRVGDLYLALAEGYTLFSATVRDDRLFVMAKDADGDFVVLDPAHLALARANGTPVIVTPAPAAEAIVAVLVDRSQSMQGFDREMDAAIDTLADTLRATPTRCAIYEFGSRITVVRRAQDSQPCAALFEGYDLSAPNGTTSLFAAMERAYADLARVDGLAAVVILSDGAPTDRPAPDLRQRAREIPTLVLWSGNHTTDHIAAYSTAHAISMTGARDDITAFLVTATAAVGAHQAFDLSRP